MQPPKCNHSGYGCEMGIYPNGAHAASSSVGDYLDDRYDSFSDDCTECAQLAAAAGVRCPKGSTCVSCLAKWGALNCIW